MDQVSDPLFLTQFHRLTDTLKVYWTIPYFCSLTSVARSPCFRWPSEAESEFWLELSVATVDGQRRDNVSSGSPAAGTAQQEIACLHLHRTSGSGELALKYLIGLGGPAGMMKLLTQDGVFKSEKRKFGGSVVQLSKIVHPAASYLTPDGSLKVYAEVRILSQTPASDFEEYTRHRVFALMRDKSFTDLTVVASGLQMRTHRLLVASASPLLYEQLKQQEADGQEAKIKLDADFAVVKLWLRFLTSGSLPVLSDEEAIQLLHFSSRQQIPALRDALQTHLAAGLTAANVARITRAAHLQKCTGLLQTCLAFIETHVNDVQDWAELFADQQSRELFELVLKVLKPE